MNKLKKGNNFKKIVKGLTILWGAILIVVITLVNVAIDPSRLNFYTWISNTLIICGIMIFGLFMGESLGVDKQTENVNGLYQKNLKDFNDRSNELERILIYFSQFFLWFKKKELYEKKLKYLIDNDVDGDMVENIVRYVKIEHLEDLSKHAIKLVDRSGKDIFIEKQEINQINAIKDVLQGKIKVDCPNPSYFLNAFENSRTQSILEEGKHIDKEISFNRHFSRAMKISVSIAISLVFSMLTVNEFWGDASSTQQMTAWLNLISRLTALTTSLFSGLISGSTEVKLRARKIKNKYLVLTLFKNAYESKEFIPQNATELAKKNYESYLEEKQKSEVIQEIVEETERIPRLEHKAIGEI